MTYTSRIPKITAELLAKADEIAAQAAETIAERAKARVPVDTGRLRDAIHVEHDGSGHEVVAGNNTAFYGHIVEHGGAHTPAHPFLVPALEESRAGIEAAAAALLRRL